MNPVTPRPPAGFHGSHVLRILVIAGAICAAFFAGRGFRVTTPKDTANSRVLYYVDPMHPAYRSQNPGKAPDCGMELQPVFAEAEAALSRTPGSIRLTPQQETAGRLETETVQATDGIRKLHSAGRIVADEAATYTISAGADGWVRRVFSDRTGSQVKQGDVLAAFFSREISAPQQAYIYAFESYERLKLSSSPAPDQLALATQQLATARDNLRFLGMGDEQIAELGRKRVEFSEVNLTAPGDGQIIERHISVGQRFMKGEILYRIANLNRVWILAEVRSADMPMGAIRGARILIDGLPPIPAQAAEAPVQFDEQGRIAKLRLIASSSHRILTPGMIVNVELDLAEPSAVTVHADAVIDSGSSKHVFIAFGGGHYELRQVQTGRQYGDRIQIHEGIRPGEQVVTAGAFLLDSETRMRYPADQATDPECGMKVTVSKALRLDASGTTYFFCSETCERKFLARRRQ